MFQFMGGGSLAPASYRMKFNNAGGLARRLSIETAGNCEFQIEPSDCVERDGYGAITVHGITSFPTRFWVRYVNEFGDDGGLSLECNEPGRFRPGPLV